MSDASLPKSRVRRRYRPRRYHVSRFRGGQVYGSSSKSNAEDTNLIIFGFFLFFILVISLAVIFSKSAAQNAEKADTEKSPKSPGQDEAVSGAGSPTSATSPLVNRSTPPVANQSPPPVANRPAHSAHSCESPLASLEPSDDQAQRF